MSQAAGIPTSPAGLPMSRAALLPRLRAAFEFAAGQTQLLAKNLLAGTASGRLSSSASPSALGPSAGLVCETPVYTAEGRWESARAGHPHDSEGFLPGMLWMFARRLADLEPTVDKPVEPGARGLSGEPKADTALWRQAAEVASRRIEERADDPECADLGIIFVSSHARWFRATNDRRVLDVLIRAGRNLARRWRPKGEYLASYLGPNSLLIEAVMNAELLFLTAKATGDTELFDLGRRTCRTVHRYMVREDGSTADEGVFDTASGRFVREGRPRAARTDSCWTRGLAAAMYGFGSAYHFTHDEEFLTTALECADYYLDRVNTDMTVPWDFGAPANRRMVDSSAMALAANGLWNLASLSANTEHRVRLARGAMQTLTTLCNPVFLAADKPGQQGVLLHGVYNHNAGLGINESTMWGDHYFVEALYKIIQSRPGDGPTGTTSEPAKSPVSLSASRTPPSGVQKRPTPTPASGSVPVSGAATAGHNSQTVKAKPTASPHADSSHTDLTHTSSRARATPPQNTPTGHAAGMRPAGVSASAKTVAPAAVTSANPRAATVGKPVGLAGASPVPSAARSGAPQDTTRKLPAVTLTALGASTPGGQPGGGALSQTSAKPPTTIAKSAGAPLEEAAMPTSPVNPSSAKPVGVKPTAKPLVPPPTDKPTDAKPTGMPPVSKGTRPSHPPVHKRTDATTAPQSLIIEPDDLDL